MASAISNRERQRGREMAERRFQERRGQCGGEPDGVAQSVSSGSGGAAVGRLKETKEELVEWGAHANRLAGPCGVVKYKRK
jgi:hypothetical protein